jgi:hypothetical protein
MLFERRNRFHLSQIQRVQVVFDTEQYRRSLTVGQGGFPVRQVRDASEFGRQDTDIQGRVHVDEETKELVREGLALYKRNVEAVEA